MNVYKNIESKIQATMHTYKIYKDVKLLKVYPHASDTDRPTSMPKRVDKRNFLLKWHFYRLYGNGIAIANRNVRNASNLISLIVMYILKKPRDQRGESRTVGLSWWSFRREKPVWRYLPNALSPFEHVIVILNTVF